jgi:hypothetical protein
MNVFFGGASALPTAVERFSTFVAAAIVGTAIAAIVAGRGPAGSSVVQPIADISKVRKAVPTTGIVSRSTAIVNSKLA